MFKPLFEDDGYKPVDRKYVPKVGPVVPSESRFSHRGRAVKDADGRVIGYRDEQLIIRRKTVCGLRDKMACASSTSKVTRFVVANGHTDRRLDAPTVNLTPPPPRKATHLKRPRSSHRMAERLI